MVRAISDIQKSMSSAISEMPNCPPFCIPEGWAMDSRQLKQLFEKTGKPKSGLASALGVRNSAVTELIAGERRLLATELPKVRHYFDLDTVPLVGFVAAGKTTFFPQETEWDRVPAPDGANENTVAVEIRGQSLGPAFDGWLAYYDNVQRPVTRIALGNLCVVGLEDGSTVIKNVRQSRLKGRVHLFSNGTEAPILDAKVEWAAIVKALQPRNVK
jgi:hypothetical protein